MVETAYPTTRAIRIFGLAFRLRAVVGHCHFGFRTRGREGLAKSRYATATAVMPAVSLPRMTAVIMSGAMDSNSFAHTAGLSDIVNHFLLV